MNVVVTGGAGFIGSHLADALIAAGHEVHVIDNLATGASEHLPSHALLHTLDIRSIQVRRLLKDLKPEVVYHQAAQVDVSRSLQNPALDASVNVGGTVNMLHACVLAGVRKFIYASSCAVYGDAGHALVSETQAVKPISFYGVSKLTPETYLRIFSTLYGLRFTILRYANVYGPRQTSRGEGGVVALFLDRAVHGQPVAIHGDGEQTRDFVHVGDVVRANLAALDRGDDELVNISTASGTSVNQLAARIRDLHGSPMQVIHTPPRPGDIRHSRLDNARALAVLGFAPQYDIERGLAATYAHAIRGVAT